MIQCYLTNSSVIYNLRTQTATKCCNFSHSARGNIIWTLTVYSVPPMEDMGRKLVKATIFNGLMIQASCNVGLLESILLGTIRIALMWVTDMPFMPLFYLFLTLKAKRLTTCVVCKSNTILGSTFNFHLVSLLPQVEEGRF